MKYTVFTDCNFPRRKTNEDTFCIVENFFEKINLYCIFDGHSGNEVSEYLKNNFSTVLKEELINQNSFSMNLMKINGKNVYKIHLIRLNMS